MSNENDFKIFLFVSLKKLIITALNSKSQNIYKKEFLINQNSNSINFEILNEFLNKNIFNIEKKLNKFVNSVFLIIDHDNFFSVNLSLKNKTSLNEINNEHINSLLIQAKNECKKTLDGKRIIHAKINKFIIDDVEYFSLPSQKSCNILSIEVNFISLPVDYIKNFEKVFNKYQIFINKIICYNYLSNFLQSESGDLFDSAVKI